MARDTGTALKVIQGADLRRRFRRNDGGVYRSFVGVTARSQIRDRLGGKLLLDLTPYLSINALDEYALDLHVPGSVTATLKTDGVWDIFFDGDYITGGRVDLQLVATQR